jgi:transforming growth factor-beta-induced protein
MVYANQAMVTLADVLADNGVVHAIDAVILPAETVADVAIDNGFSTLTTAVVTAELLPALTDPLAKYTVFAPDNAAFDDLAEALETDLEGILALPNLADVLLYHVVGAEVYSTDLENGAVTMLNGQDVTVNIDGGVVMINTSEVILADIAADNGVVHVIDEVLIPTGNVGIDQIDEASFEVFPNPSTDYIMVRAQEGDLNEIALISVDGKVVFQQQLNENESKIDVSNLDAGKYILRINSDTSVITKSVLVF